jgi:hypothetical protein
MAPIETPTYSPACAAQLREALRSASAALKENGPRFALAGSYALWAYGAPEPSHDVDLVVAEPDVASAEATLTEAGFSVEHPPEDWLFKARTGNTVVDVLHRINGVPVDSATLDCAEQCDVLSIGMPVLPPTMVLVQKLRSLGEHHCDFGKLLPAVRAIRERLDWDRFKSECADNDYAVAFLVLAERLGLTG